MGNNELHDIVSAFETDGAPTDIAPYGDGHINHTYLVTTARKRYILQQINTRIFPDCDALMNNIAAVTEFLRGRGEETLTIVPTADGKLYLKDGAFRMYEFIENTVSLQTAETPELLKNSGAAFGAFVNSLADFDASVLTETIPHFHDTPDRYRAFAAALGSDKSDRAKTCKKEIDFVLSQADKLGKITSGLSDGSVTLRVTHNDTKLNNILLDAATGKARAIIDLDTVMPGSLLYDFGDSIRFGASTALEDERDLNKVHFSLELFEAYASGYLPAVKPTLTDGERMLIPYSAYLMTTECGIRFLTDYLDGDNYFATKYPEHNLVRCRTQFRLAEEMQSAFGKMQRIVDDVIDR